MGSKKNKRKVPKRNNNKKLDAKRELSIKSMALAKKQRELNKQFGSLNVPIALKENHELEADDDDDPKSDDDDDGDYKLSTSEAIVLDEKPRKRFERRKRKRENDLAAKQTTSIKDIFKRAKAVCIHTPETSPKEQHRELEVKGPLDTQDETDEGKHTGESESDEIESAEIESDESESDESEANIISSQSPSENQRPEREKRKVAYTGLYSADWIHGSIPVFT